jgi:hypothetical protein
MTMIFAVCNGPSGTIPRYCVGLFPDLKSAQEFAEGKYHNWPIYAEHWQMLPVGELQPPLDLTRLEADECEMNQRSCMDDEDRDCREYYGRDQR